MAIATRRASGALNLSVVSTHGLVSEYSRVASATAEFNSRWRDAEWKSHPPWVDGLWGI